MKHTLVAVLLALAATAAAAPVDGENGPIVFYDPDVDMTCSSPGGNEPLNCVPSHVGDAPTLNSLHSADAPVAPGTSDKRAPAAPGFPGAAAAVEPRWCANVWCKPDCYAKGWCNGGCGDGVCKCSHKKVGWFCFND